MTRQFISFSLNAHCLAGSLDMPTSGDTRSDTGLLIVSGGNEIRSGPHGSMGRLAHFLCEHGYPVFRFDRRGVGDSEGQNRGFSDAQDDLQAACNIFRQQSGCKHILALGNCDAATGLVLSALSMKLDGIILTNPWVIDTKDNEPDGPAHTPASVRAYYKKRLLDPGAIKRLITGQISFGKLRQGLAKLGQEYHISHLGEDFRAALGAAADEGIDTHILTASADNTALAFLADWNSTEYDGLRSHKSISLIERDSASHSFASAEDAQWLTDQILDILRDF